jgi:hypothetical protein
MWQFNCKFGEERGGDCYVHSDIDAFKNAMIKYILCLLQTPFIKMLYNINANSSLLMWRATLCDTVRSIDVESDTVRHCATLWDTVRSIDVESDTVRSADSRRKLAVRKWRQHTSTERLFLSYQKFARVVLCYFENFIGICPKYRTGCCGSWLGTCLQTVPPGKELYQHQTPSAARMLVTVIFYHHCKTHTTDWDKHNLRNGA